MLIVVTGSSRGIGLELVRAFAQQKGTQILAITRNAAKLNRLLKEGALFNVLVVEADIGKMTGIRKVTNTLRKLKLKVDVLVNNAGHLVKGDFAKITESQLQDAYRVNVFAPFLLTQQLLPHFHSKGAHVLNISSMGGVQGSAKFAGLSAYSSSKGALSVLTECLAEELKPRKVHVNCLALGAVETEMLGQAFPGYKAPLSASQMAAYISRFALEGWQYYNGKVLPVSLSTP